MSKQSTIENLEELLYISKFIINEEKIKKDKKKAKKILKKLKEEDI